MARFLIYMAIVAAGASLVGWAVARRVRSLRARRRLVDRYRGVFQVPKERILELHDDFRKQVEVAVEQDGGSSLWMLPSFILDLPNGTETGEFYAIDVGGTNLRVMYCRLAEEKGKVEVEERADMVVPEAKKKGPSRDLFDFIATCLKSFVHNTGRLPSDGKRLPVGFCFSFPLDKSSPKTGVLLQWTKGYECEGAIGNDAATMLEDAFNRVGLPAEVHVVLNDTIGVLAAGRYEDDRTDVGVILGTGTNAACLEVASKLRKWKVANVPGDTITGVNTEWGCYSSDLLPKCMEDISVDLESPSPGKFDFERMTAGASLGEIARHMMATMAREGVLFRGGIPPRLEIFGAFPTACISDIDADNTSGLVTTGNVIQSHISVTTSLADRQMVKDICGMVAHRCAVLLATALVAVVQHVRESCCHPASRPTVVMFDGGCYENFEGLRGRIREATSQILTWVCDDEAPCVELKQCQGGSCLGAAILAAAALSKR